MSVKIETNQIVEFLRQELAFDLLKEKAAKLKEIDWNPFNDDGDEYTTVFAEIKHNTDLIREFLEQVIFTLETIIIGGVSLSNDQKHAIAKKMLDDAIKLPFFLEPFDGVALDMLINFAVSKMNSVEWGLERDDSGNFILPQRVLELPAGEKELRVVNTFNKTIPARA